MKEYRFERKYPATRSDLELFYSWLIDEGADFVRAHPPRTVNNIYFETNDWANYSDNLAGISKRDKCRLPWYGSTLRLEALQFEVKCRQNSVGYKVVQQIAGDQCDLTRIDTLYPSVRKVLRPDLRVKLDRSHLPVFFNRYRREYYAAGTVRMTVDRSLEYCEISGARDSLEPRVRGDLESVIEFKFGVTERPIVEHHLSRFPLRANRNSKYAIGISHQFFSMGPGLPVCVMQSKPTPR